MVKKYYILNIEQIENINIDNISIAGIIKEEVLSSRYVLITKEDKTVFVGM